MDAILRALCGEGVIAGAFDPEDRLQFASPTYRRHYLRALPLGITFSELLRAHFRGGYGVQIDSGDVERFLVAILPRRRTVPFRAFETDTVDGHWFWMTETLLPDGWLVCIATDITALKQDSRTHSVRLSALRPDQMDAETGLASAAHLLTLAEADLDGCRMRGQPLSVVVTRLEGLAELARSHGPLSWLPLIRHLADETAARLRRADALGATGATELTWVLPGVAPGEASALVERLRGWLSPVRLDGELLRYTFAAGVATAGPADLAGGLFARARTAARRAELAGRGQTVVADSDRS